MAMNIEDSDASVTRGSGNVFADLNLPDAAELHARLTLAKRLNDRLAGLGWTRSEIAQRLGIAQADVSRLLRYRLDRFSSRELRVLLDRLE